MVIWIGIVALVLLFASFATMLFGSKYRESYKKKYGKEKAARNRRELLLSMIVTGVLMFYLLFQKYGV